MEDRKSETASDELEVVQMFGINTGMRVDLKSVIVMGRVFEQAVEWIELQK